MGKIVEKDCSNDSQISTQDIQLAENLSIAKEKENLSAQNEHTKEKETFQEKCAEEQSKYGFSTKSSPPKSDGTQMSQISFEIIDCASMLAPLNMVIMMKINHLLLY